MKPSEVRAALEAGLSLESTLERLGMAHASTGDRFRPDRHDIVDGGSGEVLSTGSAAETWEWLHDMAGEEVTP